LNKISRTSLLLALLSLLGACSKTPSGQDPARDIENARRNAETLQARLAALPPACTLGAPAQAPHGSWLTAPKAMPAPGQPYTFIELFDAAMTTGAIRAGLNRAALAALDKVEIRDAGGKWLDAGAVSVHEAPAGCDYVWLQQDLGGARQVGALRYTFRRSTDPVALANAALFIAN
jgi:hypothetical protein